MARSSSTKSMRPQSAMEFLMTYGWAILTMAIILAVLFSYGVFRLNPTTTACDPVTGFSCAAPVLYTSGALSTGFGAVIPSKPITIIGVNCSSSKTIGAFLPLLPNVTVSSGQQVRLSFLCPLKQLTNPIGTPFTGFLSVKYVQQGQSTPIVQTVAEFRAPVTSAAPQSGHTWWDHAGTSANWGAIASSASGANLTAVQNYGGIYTSNNFGLSWNETAAPHDGSENWWAVASSADGTHLVAAISGGGIYNSINSGRNWYLTSAPSESWYAIAASSNGIELAAVVAGGYIYTSNNFGVTWVQTAAPNEQWEAIASSANGTKLVAGGMGTDIYTSTNAGQTWLDHGASTNGSWDSAASSADGTRISLVNSSDSTPSSSVWTSINSGQTWFDPVFASNPTSIASSADGTKLVLLVRAGDIWISNDSGQDWADQGGSTFEDWWGTVASSADGTKLAAVDQSGGDVWTSNT